MSLVLGAVSGYPNKLEASCDSYALSPRKALTLFIGAWVVMVFADLYVV